MCVCVVELCKYFVTRSMFIFYYFLLCSVFMFFVKEANGLKTNKLSCSCSCSLSLSLSLSVSVCLSLCLCLSLSLRFGVSPLGTHKLRYHKDVAPVDYSCPFCNDDVETEAHFILVCPKYAEIREQYIPKKYFTSPSSFKLALLLATTSKVLLLRLAVYIMKAFTVRNA